MKTHNWKIALPTALLAAGLIATARAEVIIVEPGGSIQAAVDAAESGDSILVRAGVYTGTPGDESVVNITKSNLRLLGSRQAVIDATGFEYGIMVGEDVDIGPEGCAPITVEGFRISGFTVRNADHTGLRLVGVNNYRISGGAYMDNREYGPFPICSTNGVINGNFASGHEDAAIYVGDDDGVVVENNVLFGNAIGIEVENSANAIVRHNRAIGNTAGVLVVVLPGLPMPFTERVLIVDNVIVGNNFPNPIPADSGSAVGLIPTGTGILNVGGDGVNIQRNIITGNDSLGVATIGNFFSFQDERIEPFVDNNRTSNNIVTGNGANPDPERALTPGADIVFIPDLIDPGTGMVVAPDPNPFDNCYSNNEFGNDFPEGITSLFPCP